MTKIRTKPLLPNESAAVDAEPEVRSRSGAEPVKVPEPKPFVGGASDGSARGAADVARRSGRPIVHASSPMFVYGSQVDEEAVTVIVRASGDDRTLSFDLTKALETLAGEHDGIRNLPTSQLGANPFATQVVYAVQPKLLATFERAATGATTERLDAVVGAKPSGRPFTEETKRALLGDGLVAKTVAMLDLHSALAKGGVAADVEERRALAGAVYALVSPLTDLFAATMIEATRARREALLDDAERKVQDDHGGACGCATCNAIAAKLVPYLDAAARANTELREAGGTASMEGIQRLVLRAAETLDRIDTPYARALLSELVPHGDGVVFAQLARRPDAAMRLVDHMLSTFAARFETTREMIGEPKNPEGVRGSSEGGGYRELPGQTSTETRFRQSPDHPFQNVSSAPLLFLATRFGATVRAAVGDAIVAADRGMPEIASRHREAEIARELSRYGRLIENAPADARPSILEELRTEAAKRADDHALTGQSDLSNLVYGLASVGLPNGKVFDEARARTEVFTLFAELLPKLTTPTVHRLVTDAALVALSNGRSAEATPDAAYQKAADALVHQLLQPGADPTAHLCAATRLAPVGIEAAVAPLVEALGHEDEEVRRAAVDSVAAMAIALEDPKKVTAPVAAAAKRAPAVFEAALAKSQAGLKKLLADPDSVWIQLVAGKALARFAPDAAVLAHAEALLSPEPTPVSFGANHPGSKNVAVRREAARVLGEMGPAARPASTTLDAAIAIGDEAKALLEKIDAARTAFAGQDTYFVELDDTLRGPARAFLDAQPDGSARAAVAFLDDPNAPDLREVPSYDRSRYPSVEGALRDLADVADAAAGARAKIVA